MPISASLQSTIWAGYVALLDAEPPSPAEIIPPPYSNDSPGPFKAVSASWTSPSPSTSGLWGLMSTWIGISGFFTDDLIQCGSDIARAGAGIGAMYRNAWLEVIEPDFEPPPWNVVLAVGAGDSMAMSIGQITDLGPALGGTWQMNATNISSGNSTVKNFPISVENLKHPPVIRSSRSAAEWIVELPTLGARTGSLDNGATDFGTVSFTNCRATAPTDQAMNAYQLVRMYYISDLGTLAPGDIGGDNMSFTVAPAGPYIERIVPNTGPHTGGTHVTIHGWGFNPFLAFEPGGTGVQAPAVRFGGTDSPTPPSLSPPVAANVPLIIEVDTPPHAAGVVDVQAYYPAFPSQTIGWDLSPTHAGAKFTYT